MLNIKSKMLFFYALGSFTFGAFLSHKEYKHNCSSGLKNCEFYVHNYSLSNDIFLGFFEGLTTIFPGIFLTKLYLEIIGDIKPK